MHKVLLTLMGIFLFVWPVFSADTIPVYTDQLYSERLLVPGEYVRILQAWDKDYTIEEVLSFPDDRFGKATEKVKARGEVALNWAVLRLANNSEERLDAFFVLGSYVDRVSMYAVQEGVVVDKQLSGIGIPPGEKLFWSRYNYLSFSVDIGEQKTFYFKQSVLLDHPKAEQVFIGIYPKEKMITYSLSAYAWQSFYAGAVLLLCLLSLLVFSLFPERVFLYLVFMLFSFILFFLTRNGVGDPLFFNGMNSRTIGQIGSSLCIFSSSLFVSQYLDLKRQMPKFFWGYAIFSLFTVSFAHLYYWWLDDCCLISKHHDYLLLAWILLSFYPVVLLAKRSYKQGKVLLLSTVILVLGIVLDSLKSLGYIEFDSSTTFFQIGTLAFFGLLFYDLFERVSKVKAQKQQVEEISQFRSRFFTNISHEFRTPLTLILGPVRQLMEEENSQERKGLLQIVYRNAVRQLHLVNQLLDLSKMEAGEVQLQAAPSDICGLLNGLVQSYESLTTQKGIRISLTYPPGGVQLYYDQSKMETLLSNLLSNAFKFTAVGGSVAVSVIEENNHVLIRIADTGKGIPSDELPFIFDRFFQVDFGRNDVQRGSGIGLPLVKELVELHKGNIEVESQEGKGTVFLVRFPKGLAHLEPGEIMASATAIVAPSWMPSFGLVEQEEEQEQLGEKAKALPRILVVEDNEDVRTFIRQRLQVQYQVQEANNGLLGIKKAKEEMPDLIICDVMMPGKNGYEVCSILKNDIRTSHIPIVLLTARAEQSDKIEGLQTGADDYLIKPFNTVELLARIDNLIKIRQQLRARFAAEVSLRPKEVSTNPIDQTFLENAMNIIEANIDNESFGTQVLAQELHLSAAHLNRKLRALLNQSTNQFIQSIRLQRAFDLLAAQTGTVAEIAFQTGFSSTAYFVKCFKNKYGETPGNIDKLVKKE